jgi:hypothetical protein
MNHIVIHCPDTALNQLEEISYLVKHHDTHAIGDFLKTGEHKAYAEPSSQSTVDCTEAVIDSSKKHFVRNTTVDEEGNEVPADGGPVGNIPDLSADSKVWQWANVSFGEFDIMML